MLGCLSFDEGKSIYFFLSCLKFFSMPRSWNRSIIMPIRSSSSEEWFLLTAIRVSNVAGKSD